MELIMILTFCVNLHAAVKKFYMRTVFTTIKNLPNTEYLIEKFNIML